MQIERRTRMAVYVYVLFEVEETDLRQCTGEMKAQSPEGQFSSLYVSLAALA